MAAPLQDSSLRTGRSGQRLAAVTRPGFAGQYEKGNNKIDRNQYSKGSARAGKTVIHRISVRASGSCRGLRPCPLCHLCPATATAAAVAASCPKQHRPSEERPLVPRCEVQRHHPPEGSCRGYIYLSLGRSRQRYQECIPKLMIKKIRNFHRYLLIITCLCQIILLNSHILSEMLKD